MLIVLSLTINLTALPHGFPSYAPTGMRVRAILKETLSHANNPHDDPIAQT